MLRKSTSVFRVKSNEPAAFIQGVFHSAFRVKCKRADVFSYCPPLRAPYHTEAAEVRPRLPNLCTPLVLDERRGSVQFRRSELHAVNHELVRQLQLLRCRCPRCDHDGLQAGAALPAAILAIPAFGWCLLSALKLASNPARPFSFIDIMET